MTPRAPHDSQQDEELVSSANRRLANGCFAIPEPRIIRNARVASVARAGRKNKGWTQGNSKGRQHYDGMASDVNGWPCQESKGMGNTKGSPGRELTRAASWALPEPLPSSFVVAHFKSRKT